MPARDPSAAAAAKAALTSSTVVSRSTSKTQSVIDALVRGTRMARPFSFPLCRDEEWEVGKGRRWSFGSGVALLLDSPAGR